MSPAAPDEELIEVGRVPARGIHQPPHTGKQLLMISRPHGIPHDAGIGDHLRNHRDDRALGGGEPKGRFKLHPLGPPNLLADPNIFWRRAGPCKA